MAITIFFIFSVLNKNTPWFCHVMLGIVQCYLVNVHLWSLALLTQMDLRKHFVIIIRDESKVSSECVGSKQRKGNCYIPSKIICDSFRKGHELLRVQSSSQSGVITVACLNIHSSPSQQQVPVQHKVLGWPYKTLFCIAKPLIK